MLCLSMRFTNMKNVCSLSERKIGKLKNNMKRTRWLMKLKDVDIVSKSEIQKLKNVDVVYERYIQEYEKRNIHKHHNR